MSGETKRVFKKRTFGGFDKDDVLNYIESAAQKCKEETESLKKEIEERDKEIETLKSENAGLSERITALELDNGQKNQEIAGIKNELSKANDTIKELRGEVSGYDRMKADIAGIELSARKRAKEIERESQKTLDKIRDEAEKLINETKDRFAYFVDNIGEQVNQAESTLDAAKTGYKTLLSGLSGLKDKLKGLEKSSMEDIAPMRDLKEDITENNPGPEAETQETGAQITEPVEAETERETVKTGPVKENGEAPVKYIEDAPQEAKHLSLKELMERLKGR
ncbi:MAG: hypothetical protein Q8878_06925 [Bacillota bacterium]|nr:hypothetical protein [Bacillota bacterium]